MNRFHNLTVGQREVVVYLPPSYESSEQHYPVAYVQDGGFLFTECSNYLEHLFAKGELQELILVGIGTDIRNDEYTPWPAESLTPNKPPFGGRGKEYVNEITNILKPHIDEHFRTRKEAGYTAMIGGSFGGLISLFAGYWRPDVFGRLGLLSASFWYEGLMDYIRKEEGLSKELRIYMSAGLCEGIYKQNKQKNMVPYTQEAVRLFIEKGFPEGSLQMTWIPEGTHDDVFMVRQFPEALKWLFNDHSSSIDEVDESNQRFSIPGTFIWNMQSQNTGRTYQISIVEPVGEPPEAGYPVLYTLDANASFGTLAESIRLQSRRPHGISPAVIVGIGYESKEPIVTKERFYDYTVYADNTELPARPDGFTWPETGGADDFLAFIEEELKPVVENHCFIDRSKQALFGHSLGGFFALYTLFTRPEVFQRYIAASPSIWWGNYHLHKKWNERKEQMEQLEIYPELFMAIGSEEKPSMVQDAWELYRILTAGSQRIRSVMQEIEGEGHVSLIPSLISSLLRFVTK
ncbi:alpha/beta hydrolase [Paenibacillus dakarensis]|uniref:alpha/beta hydrolase n=1 Tax=Paenibacillus dakarensis TaxID=1527293 RepID=UPI0006D54476|nr:alpha/beta hydrolase-fold protein [Paenibacillus dakarensis]